MSVINSSIYRNAQIQVHCNDISYIGDKLPKSMCSYSDEES